MLDNNKKKICIVSIEPQKFVNEKTGVVNEMLKITYLVKINKDTERFYGNNILVSYVPSGELEKIKKFITIPNVDAVIEERATEKGTKWALSSVNDVKLRN